MGKLQQTLQEGNRGASGGYMKGGTGGVDGNCFNCGKSGHISIFCPQRNTENNRTNTSNSTSNVDSSTKKKLHWRKQKPGEGDETTKSKGEIKYYW